MCHLCARFHSLVTMRQTDRIKYIITAGLLLFIVNLTSAQELERSTVRANKDGGAYIDLFESNKILLKVTKGITSDLADQIEVNWLENDSIDYYSIVTQIHNGKIIRNFGNNAFLKYFDFGDKSGLEIKDQFANLLTIYGRISKSEVVIPVSFNCFLS